MKNLEVHLENQKHEKLFIGSFANIRNKEGNMNTRKYLISSALIIFVILAMAAPVTAIMGYSASVQSFESGSISSLSASKLSLIQGYTSSKNTESTSTSMMSSGKASALNSFMANGYSPSIGTVSAFSKFKSFQQDEDGSSSFMEFSQSVSVTGEIYTFDFSTNFF
jgi:hypothetical protein